jgi:hypothetical protein
MLKMSLACLRLIAVAACIGFAGSGSGRRSLAAERVQ